ncbi:COX assembly mitochondrial protein 2 homolog isoform X2 [Spea bombifrons]|uniref:COX assembly mitochondrial protein 2 homolog isoform X2 n=1 Tax=Spea bombifrons TaxID=233779 RepID=UPI002349E5BB|nr:COX assembly mitochondrial protein 2 homolog isoform X2 [Spea bombifrons]XP_053304961.1 COX assembly mitochondrial protein 2 homolog isoform X2 [Spea bombifrons]
MHPDLSPHLHTDECNVVINMLKQCHLDNKFLKYFGQCNDINREMLKCLKKEYEDNRAKNRAKSEEMRQRHIQAQREAETQSK